jgi:hypothetical protein
LLRATCDFFLERVYDDQDDIIDVSEVDFEYEVIDYSKISRSWLISSRMETSSLEMSRMLVSLGARANAFSSLARGRGSYSHLAILFGVRSVHTV